MNYSDARPKIKSGDLLSWSHRTPMLASWHDFKVGMVRLFGRSEYSHVGTAWAFRGRLFVIEAVKVGGVRLFPLSRAGDFFWVPQTRPRWNDAAEEFAMSVLGCQYSELQAAQAPFGEPAEDDLFQCAELYRAIAKRMGVECGSESTPWAVVSDALDQGRPLYFIKGGV